MARRRARSPGASPSLRRRRRPTSRGSTPRPAPPPARPRPSSPSSTACSTASTPSICRGNPRRRGARPSVPSTSTHRHVDRTKETTPMAGKAVVSLTTGLEDPEKVMIAFLVAVGAAESGRPTLMFLTKEAVRIALDGVAVGVACDGCPSLADLLQRYEAAGGRYYVCPICFNTKRLDAAALIAGAELQGTLPLWQWIGDEGAT